MSLSAGRRPWRGERGATLVEVMVTLAIMVMMAWTATILYLEGIKLWYGNNAQVELTQHVLATMPVMTRLLRQAKSDTVVIDRLDASQPPYSRIGFITSDSQGTTVNGQGVTFYQQGIYLKQALKMSPTATTEVNTVSSLMQVIQFYYPNTGDDTIVGVNFCVQKPTYAGGKNVLQLAIQKVRVMN